MVRRLMQMLRRNNSRRVPMRRLNFVPALMAVAFFHAISLPSHGALGGAAKSSEPVWSASFKDLKGERQSLSQWKGKVTIIYFWATWCAPCHKEAPRLSALYKKHAEADLVVVGIAVDNADKVRTFVDKYQLQNPIVYGGTEAIQLGRDLGNALGAIPYTVVINRNGDVIKTIRGDTPDGKLEALIGPLLG